MGGVLNNAEANSALGELSERTRKRTAFSAPTAGGCAAEDAAGSKRT